MSMNRQDIQDRLMDYLYEEMSSDEARAFEQGLREHPDLAAEVDGHRRTRAMFERLPELEVPHLVTANILREARKAASASRSAHMPRKSLMERLLALLLQPATATAMVVLLVAGVGVYIAERGMLSSDKDQPDDLYRPASAPAELRAEGGARPAAIEEKVAEAEESAPLDEATSEAAPAPEPEVAAAAAVETTTVAPAAGEARKGGEAERPATSVADAKPSVVETKASKAQPKEVASKAGRSLDGLLMGDRKKMAPVKAQKSDSRKDEDLAFLGATKQADELDDQDGRMEDAEGEAMIREPLDDTPQMPNKAPAQPKLELKKESATTASGIASNVEQRPGSFRGDSNAVRDGFAGLEKSNGADQGLATGSAAQQPEAEPSAYPAQQQQMRERRAEEIVYGGTAATGQGGAAADPAEQQQAVAAPAPQPVAGLANEQAQGPSAQDLLAQGDAQLAQGNAQAAVDLYDSASRADAALTALARHKTARAYRSANRFLDALMSYDGLLETYPRYQNRLAALEEKFEVSMTLGRLDVAEKVLKEMELVDGGGSRVASLRERLYARRVAQEQPAADSAGQKAGEPARSKAGVKAKSEAPAAPAMEFDKVVK